ncbi:MyfA/PsaA family fimbrial adhesin [Yersinia enterocolitica]|uniref:MyfA/PsaA family fimbrial adhesin n=1 Tax=Yersinia enterocolitica TaxID=630 RepID=UPI00398C8838
MNMKNFVKKPLAIAVLMLASGGMVNMVHAASPVTDSRDISATRTVKAGGEFSVKFEATENDIVAGKLAEKTPAFHLTISDAANHGGFNVWPTGASEGGMMVSIADGSKVELHSHDFAWDKNHWWVSDPSQQLEATFYLDTGTVVKAGEYQFTGRVEEYAA